MSGIDILMSWSAQVEGGIGCAGKMRRRRTVSETEFRRRV
jgi:hypothetical protein